MKGHDTFLTWVSQTETLSISNVVFGSSEALEIISQSPSGKNYIHNNAKPLLMFFDILTFSLMVQKQMGKSAGELAQIKTKAPNHTTSLTVPVFYHHHENIYMSLDYESTLGQS